MTWTVDRSLCYTRCLICGDGVRPEPPARKQADDSYLDGVLSRGFLLYGPAQSLLRLDREMESIDHIMIRPHEDFSSAKSEVQRVAESSPSRASEPGRTKLADGTDDLITELAAEGFHLAIFGRLGRGALMLATASGEGSRIGSPSTLKGESACLRWPWASRALLKRGADDTG